MKCNCQSYFISKVFKGYLGMAAVISICKGIILIEPSSLLDLECNDFFY
jgi:hypothetical protein